KILRIDVDNGDPYSIPLDNPFANKQDAEPEIWAYGLRNPWRFGFDRETGDLYIADVGQNAFEEVNFQPASSNGGENYGWPIAEGFECLGGGGDCGSDPGFTPPVVQYGQPVFQAVIGGYVYRGDMYPEIQGLYFYADHLSNRVWTFPAPDAIMPVVPTEQTASFAGLTRISSFGEGGDGELYVTDFGGSLHRIVLEPPDDAR
ncbi:MAG: PQQ-dependent sugar dehydrogenase, partial [Candidatus Hydrogenedentales bacterium]